MKKFLINLTLFVLVFVLIDRALALFLNSQRPIDYKLFLESKERFFEEEQQIDLLILGDSHVADALDTRILEQETRLKCYNLAVYHSSPFEQYYLALYALKQLKTPPKQVILGTNPIMFERPLSKGKYTPLIIKDQAIATQLALNSVEGLEASFFLNSVKEEYLLKAVKNKILGTTYQPTREIKSSYKGHLEFYNQVADTKWSEFKSDSTAINPVQVEYLEKMIQLLQAQNIELIFVNTPIWFEKYDQLAQTESFKAFKNTLKAISQKYGIPIFNPDHQLLRNELQKSDFLNADHLNYKGAKKFTRKLIENGGGEWRIED